MAWSDVGDIGLAALQTDYIARLNTLMDRSEAVNDEVVAARSGQADLITSLDLRFDAKVAYAGATQDINGGGFKAVNFVDAVASTDLTTLQQVNALILAGVFPSDAEIMDFKHAKTKMYFFGQL